MKQRLSDNIVAISTPPGESGIGIVRISGPSVLEIADRIFLSKDGSGPSKFKTHTIHYGYIVDKEKRIDEVLLTVMRAPRTYTREDIVEMNCHGGIVVLREVLDLVLDNGCRLAEPGEFTKRAFLSGRIDLSQAEAVLDIIRAKTDAALKISTAQLKGALSSRINKIRKTLLDIISQIEANIDFPEEEIKEADLKDIGKRLEGVNNELRGILYNSKHGRIFREGVHVVICGKPNAGKSSLLNALLKQERSIVTPVAGTTRDTIEEIIDIKGVPIRVVDTAGILKPRDSVERKAVQRSKKYIDLADLIILIFDGSKGLSREDRFLMDKVKKRQVIAVVNKIDLKQKIEKKKILKRFKHVVDISAKKSKNINLLEEAMLNLVYGGSVSSSESVLVSNLRHITVIKEAQRFIMHATSSLNNRLSLEFISQDIKEAVSCLDDIVGKRFSEDLLNKIFSQFCIGK